MDRQTGETGQFRLADYPWLRELYALDQEATDRLVIRKGAQLGISEYLVNFALWAIHQRRMTIFYALPPGGNIVNDFSHQRVSPAITDTRVLMEQGMDPDNVAHKRFDGGGAIFIRGTNIPMKDPRRAAQLSAVPADVAIIDEIDRVPPAALPLIRSRLEDSRFKLERDVSTPTVPGFGVSVLYEDTDQREPEVQCDVCGQWRALAWEMVSDDGVLTCRCGAALDMGERWNADAVRYQPQNTKADVVGYWIPALVSPRADLSAMMERSRSSDEETVQAFWNNDLGLAYEPRGAKLTTDMLEACKRDYEFAGQVPGARSVMGVDVQGADLHVYVKHPVEGGKHRALWVGTVPDFGDLDGLMVRYDVACCVVDAMPEIRGAAAFVERWRGRAYLAWFGKVEGASMTAYNEPDQRVRVDRDRAILASHANVEQQVDELPRDYSFIQDFVEQMTVNVRVRTETAQGQVVYKFPKTGRADHYDLAKAYCEVAMERMYGGVPMAPLRTVEQPVSRSRWDLSRGQRDFERAATDYVPRSRWKI